MNPSNITTQLTKLLAQAAQQFQLDLEPDQIHLEVPDDSQFGDYATNLALQQFKHYRQQQSKLKKSKSEASQDLSNVSSKPQPKSQNPRQFAQALCKQLEQKLKLKGSGLKAGSAESTKSAGSKSAGQPEERVKPSQLTAWIKDVTVAGPGFINFHLSQTYFLQQLKTILDQPDYGHSTWGKDKTWEIEHTSPNPNKAMHLGHLRNNVTGMAIANLWEAIGIEVIRDAVDNNRGIAIARLMWGYLKFAHSSNQDLWQTNEQESESEPGLDPKTRQAALERVAEIDLNYWRQHQDQWFSPQDVGQRPDHFVEDLYVWASQEFKQNSQVEQQVRQMVVAWEEGDKAVRQLWQTVLDFSHQGQDMTLERLGNQWDKVWHEHEHYQQGKDLVRQGLEQNIFRQLPDGAILTDLSAYDLPDTILRKSDGTSLYITQDLALTQLKIKTFKADKLHWVIGPEQSLALKQMFAVCEQLDIAQRQDLTHIAYGYMSIKNEGKMSSREGNVVHIDQLIDAAKVKIKSIIKKNYAEVEEQAASSQQELQQKPLTNKQINNLAEAVAVGAVKYSILKVARRTDTAFDFKTALDFQGNSGPYLQYTHARACSVLNKAGLESNNFNELSKQCAALLTQDGPDLCQSALKQGLNQEELALLRHYGQFPAVVFKAALDYEPSAVATYLHQLAQLFNTFYNQHQIIQSDPSFNSEQAEYKQAREQLRLALTAATAQLLRTGLNLLGITAPHRM
jgi:arginyl-tRNA synthetase